MSSRDLSGRVYSFLENESIADCGKFCEFCGSKKINRKDAKKRKVRKVQFHAVYGIICYYSIASNFVDRVFGVFNFLGVAFADGDGRRKRLRRRQED